MEDSYKDELKVINTYLDHTIEDHNNIRIPSNVKLAISVLSRKMDFHYAKIIKKYISELKTDKKMDFHYAKIIKNYISELKIDKVDVPSNVVNAVDVLYSKTFNI